MKRKLLAVVLVLMAGGCNTGQPDSVAAPASPPPSSPPSAPASSPTTKKARFADLTKGNTTSVVIVHGYDPANASAIVEPIIFMTGDAYCRTFKTKRSDDRCIHHEYVEEESHTKVTVPIAATAKYFTWEGADGAVCIDAPEKGGTCPMTAKQFAKWLEGNKRGMVAVATEDGAITRMAIVYTP